MKKIQNYWKKWRFFDFSVLSYWSNVIQSKYQSSEGQYLEGEEHVQRLLATQLGTQLQLFMRTHVSHKIKDPRQWHLQNKKSFQGLRVTPADSEELRDQIDRRVQQDHSPMWNKILGWENYKKQEDMTSQESTGVDERKNYFGISYFHDLDYFSEIHKFYSENQEDPLEVYDDCQDIFTTHQSSEVAKSCTKDLGPINEEIKETNYHQLVSYLGNLGIKKSKLNFENLPNFQDRNPNQLKKDFEKKMAERDQLDRELCPNDIELELAAGMVVADLFH